MGGVFIETLSEHVVRNTAGIMSLLHEGARLRTTGSTKMNKVLEQYTASVNSLSKLPQYTRNATSVNSLPQFTASVYSFSILPQ